MARFKHLHSSSRFNRSPASLKKAVNRYVKDAHIITFTEVDFTSRQRALREVAKERGYGVVIGNKGEANDCAILYRKKRFELIYSENYRVATQTILRADGKQRGLPYATIAVLEDKVNGKRLVIAVVHLPASVERELARKNMRYRRAIQWRQAFKNTKKRVNRLAKKHKARGRFIVADWNIDFKKAWARALVKSMAPSYKNAWKRVKIAGGTFFKRVIDGTIYRGKVKLVGSAKLYRDDNSSDHQPYIETFKW